MGNKKLRNTLLALAMTPFFALATTGCWKATTDDEPSEVNQTEAYSILRSHVNKDNFIVDSDSNEVNFTATETYSITGDWTNSSIPNNEREEVSNILDIPLQGEREDYTRKELDSYGYNNFDNTGYHVNKRINNNNSNDNEMKLYYQDFTKQSNDKFYKYTSTYDSSYDTYYKKIFHTDDKYAKNTYRNEAFEFCRELLNPVVLSHIKNNEDIESFKQETANFNKELFYESFDIPEDTTLNDIITTFNITLTDGVYSLNSSLDIKNVKTEEPNVFLNSNIELSLQFNSDNILNINISEEISFIGKISCKEEIGSNIPNVTFDDNDHILVTESQKYSYSFDFFDNFDNSIINQDLTGYTGTGGYIDSNNREILGDKVNLKIVYLDLDNFTDGFYRVNYSTSSYLFGDVLDFNYSDRWFKFNDYEDCYTKTYFWDKECTIPVPENATCPSYDTNIYVKLTVNEGYALVLEKVWSSYSDGETYISTYNSKSSIIELSKSNTYNLNYSSSNINNVYFNNTEVTDYTNGITLPGSGIYCIDINKPQDK